MGRQAWRMHKDFEKVHPVGQAWWGFVLDPVPCQSCSGSGAAGDGWCPVCEGEGDMRPRVEPPGYPANKAPAWLEQFGREYGWQMWANTSEGSPISPVFDTPDELARWLAENGASAFGSMGLPYESWLRAILGDGVGGVLMDTDGARPAVVAAEEGK